MVVDDSIILKVAVMGAGISGLIAARELLRGGHRVVIYEKSNQLGGTWVYDPRVDLDPLGLDPNREAVHSSLYASLRPRHLMSLSDYPFTDRVYGDPRNFPRHEEVLEFVKDFAREFGLTELIRFETEVVRVERVDSADDGWIVESRMSGASGEEEFEAVVVCTGHDAEPRVANLPGLIEKWPGEQLHSHNYRVPDPFQNQVVVIIGSGPSAIDISCEVASVAKQVHISSRSPRIKLPNFDNTWQHLEVCSLSSLELQSKWIARVLSGKAILPLEKEMLVDIEEHYRDMVDQGVPKHHTHRIHPHEFEYPDKIADLAGVPRVVERTREIRKHYFGFLFRNGMMGLTQPFRDKWDPKDIYRAQKGMPT